MVTCIIENMEWTGLITKTTIAKVPEPLVANRCTLVFEGNTLAAAYIAWGCKKFSLWPWRSFYPIRHYGTVGTTAGSSNNQFYIITSFSGICFYWRLLGRSSSIAKLPAISNNIISNIYSSGKRDRKGQTTFKGQVINVHLRARHLYHILFNKCIGATIATGNYQLHRVVD